MRSSRRARPDPTLAGWRGPFAAFALLQAASALAMGIATFSLGFRLLASTGSPGAYSVVSALALLPVGLATPTIGAWVDRIRPARFLFGTAVVAALAVLVMTALLTTDSETPWLAWVVLSLANLSLGAQFAAELPYACGLVPAHLLSRANAALQLTTVVPRLAGAAIASFAYASGHTLELVWGSLAAVIVAGAWARTVSWRAYRIAPPTEGEAPRGAVAVGLGFIVSQPLLLALVVLLFVRRSALVGFETLVHPLVLEHGTAALVGVVMTAGTIGFAVAGALLVVLRIERPLGWLLGAAAIGGLGLLALGQGSAPVVLIAGAFTVQAAELATVTSNQLWWQRAAPAASLGRVTAMRDLLAGSGSLVGALLAGPLAAWLDARWALGAGRSAGTILSGFAVLVVLAVVPVAILSRRRSA